MDKALTTLFCYIWNHHLQDTTNLSIVNNNTWLYGCQLMLLLAASLARGILLRWRLFVKVDNNVGEMRQDAAMDNNNHNNQEKKKKKNEKIPQSDRNHPCPWYWQHN